MLYLAKQLFAAMVGIVITRKEKHMSNGTKGWWSSKTIWGVIIQLIALGSIQLGYDIGDQGMWVNAIVGAIGAVLTVIGRIKAVKKLG